jgi:hypothetical protein
MSIRLLARDLYRLHREVEALEKELESTPPAEQEEIGFRLRAVRAERDRLRRTLDGQKDA